jgi:hypothetical protein
VSARAWARKLLDEAGHAEVDVPVAPDGDVITDWTESGAVWLTGRSAGRPIVPPGGAATAARGAGLAFAAFSALMDQPVEVAGHLLLGERAALAGLQRRAPWNLTVTCRSIRSHDGWFVLNLARADDVSAVPALIERDVRDGEGTAWTSVRRWARTVKAAEAVERAQLLGMPAGVVPVEPPRVEMPVRYERIMPGDPTHGRPLVVDMSALWAGPLCANLLGMAGARVIKVEAPNRLDGFRAGCPPMFDLLHAGHESVLVDFRSDSARLVRLIEQADIVIASCRPRALEQMGIDPVEVCRRSPTTWVGITAYDRRGVWSNRVGFGDDVAMTAGLTVRSAVGAPMPCGDAIADPLAGIHAAVGALGSYLRGGSGLVDVAMHDVVAATMALGSERQVSAVREGRSWWVPTPGGRVPIAAPRARSGMAVPA